ncbi:PepSY domain-containing protein [Streptomyces qinzhouensis]|uniref:PepSY domain-containing protein n=1 Tax=Streptomyces qinzhouensis TaxID=2599401 RepID=A0A5B8IKN6_9ACTN|nr:PepSY domain-containing protein [Streptomyces qinzhouensis]QDY79068.1 PepSY domain-containing protein [Streptomyces qinzhouensis]
MKRKIVIATAVAALMAGGTLTAFAATGSSDDRTPPAAKVSLTEATDAALAKVPGTVESADRDDDGKGDWEIDIRTSEGTEREVTVDAQNGTVRVESGDDRHDDADDRDDRDEQDDDRDDAAAAAAAKTTSAEAEAAALKLHPGTVTEVEFDDARWQIDIKGKDGKSYDVNVDATTAKATTDQDN